MLYAIVKTLQEAEQLNELMKQKYYELVNNAHMDYWTDIIKHKDSELYALIWYEEMNIEDVPFSFEFTENIDGWIEIDNNNL